MTFQIRCPHCGQTVEARDAGFSATTVTVAPCDEYRASGISSWEIRKSAAYEAAVPAETFRHKDGFVTFG